MSAVPPPHTLPRTARDVFHLRPRDRLLYGAVIAFAERTGRWQAPVPASGDLETMTFWDKAYWLYKASRPIEVAERGSGLEAYFAAQASHRWSLPEGFRPACRVGLSAAGDLMQHPYLHRSGETLYDEVREVLFDSDLAMANLECVVMDGTRGDLAFSPTAGPALHLDPREFDIVRGASAGGFGFLATACNHSLDFGPDGVDATIRALRDRGVAHHGTNAREADAEVPTVLDLRGVRIGVVAHCFGLNAYQPPADRPRIVNRANLNAPLADVDLSLVDRQLEGCRQQEVDLVVAHLHWGMEHERYPRQTQVDLAHALAERGVDLILGHHPHVAQPVEFYRTRRDPDRVVPIYYSLGNLTNPFTAPFLCRSLVARVELVKGRRADGEVRTYVARAGAESVRQVVDADRRALRLLPDGKSA